VAPGGGGEGGPVVVVGMRGRLRDIAGMLRFFEGVFSLSLSSHKQIFADGESSTTGYSLSARQAARCPTGMRGGAAGNLAQRHQRPEARELVHRPAVIRAQRRQIMRVKV
jgi:hypothetical protein